MHKLAIAGVIVAALGVTAFFSAGPSASGQAATTQPAAKAPTSRPVNKMCPVMTDNKIDPTLTYVYKGKVYGFCCADCIADFKKDPEKYLASIK